MESTYGRTAQRTWVIAIAIMSAFVWLGMSAVAATAAAPGTARAQAPADLSRFDPPRKAGRRRQAAARGPLQ